MIQWINAHKTKLTGVLLIALGAIQSNATYIQAILSPRGYALAMICAGVFVAVLGFLNNPKPGAP